MLRLKRINQLIFSVKLHPITSFEHKKFTGGNWHQIEELNNLNQIGH